MSEQLLCTFAIVQLSNEHSHDAECTELNKLVVLLILLLSLYPVCCNFTGGLSNGERVSTALLLIWLIIFSH